MQFYLDITLIPNDDFKPSILLNKAYQQLHLSLVEHKNRQGYSQIGVSFPEYQAERRRLGRKIRVFAPERKLLDDLKLQEWFDLLSDYIHITSIRVVPDTVEQYVSFKRQQIKSNRERLARRLVTRYGISEEQAQERLGGFKSKRLALPYVSLQSLSTGHPMRLFIKQEAVTETEKQEFNTYGLSKGGGVPWF